LRAIEVPDHAFSIQYEGTKHADVETTNAAGFNPARDPRILKRFTQQTGFSYIPDRHADKRREVTNIGLMALTYYNHGVTNGEKEQYAVALVDYFRALSLDPEFPSAIQNVLSTLHNWSGEQVGQKKFAEGLKIVDIGLRLAPEDKRFLHNQQALWQTWAVSEIENNNRQEALEILTRAAKAMPKAGFEEMRAYAYIYPGEKLAQTQDWEAALKLAATGLKTLPAVAQKELRRWRNNVFNRWTITTIEKKEYAVTADILEQAIKADPQERDFLRNIGFVVQEWLIATEAKEGLAAAETLVSELAGRFGEIRDANKVIESFVRRAAFQMIKKKQYDQAQALIDRQQKQLDKNTFRDLHRQVFVSQASTYQKANDWSAAGEVYLKALESGIDNREMGKRVGFCVQELVLDSWKKDGPEAAEKYLAAWVEKKPELKSIRTAAAIYVQSVVQKHQRDKQPAQALIAANRCRKLITVKDHEHFVHVVCDQWAQTHSRKAEWDKAVAVYALGLKSLPKDRHLTRNAVITWDERAKRFIKTKQWGEAIKVYDLALKQFPNHSTLRNNLKYCLQQANQ
jgi:tetratricopeptide (TPR) repeat protein